MSAVVIALSTLLRLVIAGTVITRSGSVRGVATAASIWISAAIGCAVAPGHWGTAIASALLATMVNALSLQLQNRFAAGTGEGL
jgi:uncharacterized membrane protein YhiD involved in acid resistance